MNETNISFYLRTNRIHIFIDALRQIGCPAYICFLIQNEGRFLAVVPYNKKDFRSHRVSPYVYDGTDSMEVSSLKLCRVVSELHRWDPALSYRVPGFVLNDHSAIIFDLANAETVSKH